MTAEVTLGFRSEKSVSSSEPTPNGPSLKTEAIAIVILKFACIGIVLFQLPTKIAGADSFAVPKEFMLCASVAAFAILLLSRCKRISLDKVDFALIGFWTVGVLTAVTYAIDPWASIRVLAIVGSGIGLYWTARTLAQHGNSMALSTAITTAVVLAAFTGLVEAYGLLSPITPFGLGPGGTFGNRNLLAHVVVLGLPSVVAGLMFQSQRPRGTLKSGAALFTLVIVLVLSRARGAWLGATFSIITILAIELTRRDRHAYTHRRSMIAALVCAIAILCAVNLPNTLSWSEQHPFLQSVTHLFDYHTGTGRGRLMQYENTMRMFGDYPNGLGPGNWRIVYPRYASSTDPSYTPTNVIPTARFPSGDWIAVISEWGIMGLLMLLVIGLFFMRLSSPKCSDAPMYIPTQPCWVLPSTLVGLVVMGVFDPVLHHAVPVFVVAIIAGIASGNAHRNGRIRPLIVVARYTLGIRVVAITLAVGCAISVGLHTASIVAYAFAPSVGNLELASSLYPGDYRVQMMLAGALKEAGRCNEAIQRAEYAHKLFPSAISPIEMIDACVVKTPPAASRG